MTDRRKISDIEQMQRELQDFVYSVSHDLSAPLRHIREFSKILVATLGDDLPKDAKQAVDIIQDSVKLSEAKMAGLLEYSRLNTLAKPHNMCQLETVYEAVNYSLSGRIQTTGAVIHVPDVWPEVPGDQDHLQQLFYHLLDNALKFQPVGQAPEITIECDVEEDCVRFRWQDNGIGIKPEQVYEVFKVFRRLHVPAEYPGVGIGLTLCKKIVEVHGGQIEITPQEGPGCCVVFSLRT